MSVTFPPRTESRPASTVVQEVPFIEHNVLQRTLAERAADYVQLCKPRIAIMVLVTVAVGYLLGSEGWVSVSGLLQASFGIALAAFGSSALNQWLEQDSDALMPRTMIRPLPAGRLGSMEVLVFGLVLSAAGVAWLVWQVNLITAGLTAATVGLYAGVYTPLKRHTSFCTAIGAIPGALPPLLGWTAATGGVSQPGWALFAILFLWQFPHFLAIAWLYREHYAGAGLRMLPNVRPQPHVTGLMATLYALCLLPISLVPMTLGMASWRYGIVALAMGLLYLVTSVRFAMTESRTTARQILWASLVYLPVVLLALTLDYWRGLGVWYWVW